MAITNLTPLDGGFWVKEAKQKGGFFMPLFKSLMLGEISTDGSFSFTGDFMVLPYDPNLYVVNNDDRFFFLMGHIESDFYMSAKEYERCYNSLVQEAGKEILTHVQDFYRIILSKR